jgi:subtilisin
MLELIIEEIMYMRKIALLLLTLGLFSGTAHAKRYLITVENDTRAPVNWEAFVTRGGGSVVEKFDFIDGAVLDITPEQAQQLLNRRAPGMTIEEDTPRKWLLDKDTSFSALSGLAVRSPGKSVKPSAAVPQVPAPKAGKAERTGNTRAHYYADQINPKGEFPWSITRMDLKALWEVTQGEGIKVGVIDTGINYNHEDLKDNYAGGKNCIEPDNPAADPLDDQGHGTHVAGTIAAVYNSTGVVGIAPKASLYAVKVMDKNGAGMPSDIVRGIEWAIKNGMNVLNMSIGSPAPSEAMHKAIKKAVANNITVVCASGNEATDVSYPAAFPETIAVGASDPNDDYAPFSNYGPQVDFIAPGKFVYSTMIDGKYAFQQGTSMACPHIAGMAALAYSLGYRTPANVKAALKAAAVPLKQLPVEQQGSGLPLGSKLLQNMNAAR